MKSQSLWRSEMLPEKEGAVSVACSISLTGHSSRTKSKSHLLWKCTILAVQKSFFFFLTSVLPCSRERRTMQWKSAESYAYSGGCPNKRQQGAGKMTQSATSCLEYLDRPMFYPPDPHKKLSTPSRVCDPGTGEAESGRPLVEPARPVWRAPGQ